MTVKELIANLQLMDEDATVYLTVQGNYPMELSIRNVVERQDVDDVEFDDEYMDDRRAKDVLIIEEGRVRHGSRDAFTL